MSVRVCLVADTLSYPEGGGHFWVYLNWALGLRTAGCEVSWLEVVTPDVDPAALSSLCAVVKQRLDHYDFGQALLVCDPTGRRPDCATNGICRGLDSAASSDLLLNFRYSLDASIVDRFPHSALLDIDPGLLQIWISEGQASVTRHNVYFTTGETVGRPGSLCPETGIIWEYIPPCVAVDCWPMTPPGPHAAFTTISHWSGDEWVQQGDQFYVNDKRAGFEPFFDLPKFSAVPLELALCLAPDEDADRCMLRERGWRVVDASSVSSTPWGYQYYVQSSLGEFSAVKPSCVRLQNAWISDRSLCYLASGKPVVVQDTGSSRFLPDGEGIFRFRTIAEADSSLRRIMSDYDRHSRKARALAEEYFDATKVARCLLKRALS